MVNLPGDGWHNVKDGHDADNNKPDAATCGCGLSWWEHWKKFTGDDWPLYCCVKDCTETIGEMNVYDFTISPTSKGVGGHVYSTHEDVKGWWIAPMCKGCNSKSSSEELTFDAGTKMVRVAKEYTCDKVDAKRYVAVAREEYFDEEETIAEVAKTAVGKVW